MCRRERFAKRREESLAENEARRQRRDQCLRDSAAAGAFAGLIGATLMFRTLRAPSANTTFTRTLLGIKVSGNEIGGAGQAFCVFVGFFMPFTFVAQTTRWKCQKAGLQLNAAPTAADTAWRNAA